MGIPRQIEQSRNDVVCIFTMVAPWFPRIFQLLVLVPVVNFIDFLCVEASVADSDPYVFGPLGSGSISQRYGS
jgi:hypothetical protein